MWRFKSKKHDPKHELIVFLKSISYFRSLPDALLIGLSREFTPFFVQSGHTLIKEGGVGDSLYIIQTGRLLVIKNKQDNELILGEMTRGDLVGELSLFTQQPRAATVIAIRDSWLWKLSKEQFDHFVKKNATHVMPIVRTAILRLLEPNQLKSQTIRSITIAPAGHCPFDKEFIRRLAEQLSASAPTLLLNSAVIKKQFTNIHPNTSSPMDLTDPIIAEWLNEQEQQYTYVLYETDDVNTEWTRLCLRQADKILLLADAADNGALGGIEHYLFYSLEKTYRVSIELLLMHQQSNELPTETTKWMKERSVKIHHIKKDSQDDLKRITRALLGRRVGLVLGGGGAKSLAQIGVYKALCELNIPIDLVAGTSMGGVIAANIAMNLTVDEIINNLKKYVILNKKFNDYTLPSVSLLGGKGWGDALKALFGEHTYIEDLWLPFFCVASNFTQRKIELLMSGLLYKSVRASAALPGVVPPISNERNELLIDGGIFNNLPVDIMRKNFSPCDIIAVRVSPFSDVHAHIPDGVVSGIARYLSRFGKKPVTLAIPSITEILIGAITLCNDEQELIQLANANHSLDIDLSQFNILDFSKYVQLIDIGYRAAIEQFQYWK